MSEDVEQIYAKLCAYVDGDLTDAERAQIEAHLAAHPAHAEIIREVKECCRLLGKLPREGAPAELMESLQGQLEREALLDDAAAEHGPIPLAAYRWPRFLAAAAMLLLALGLAGIILTLLPGKRPVVSLMPTPAVPEGSTAASLSDDGLGTAGREPAAKADKSATETDAVAIPKTAMKPGPFKGAFDDVKQADRAVGEIAKAGRLTERANDGEVALKQGKVFGAMAGGGGGGGGLGAAPLDTRMLAENGTVVLTVNSDDLAMANSQVLNYLKDNRIAWLDESPAPEEEAVRARRRSVAVATEPMAAEKAKSQPEPGMFHYDGPPSSQPATLWPLTAVPGPGGMVSSGAQAPLAGMERMEKRQNEPTVGATLADGGYVQGQKHIPTAVPAAPVIAKSAATQPISNSALAVNRDAPTDRSKLLSSGRDEQLLSKTQSQQPVLADENNLRDRQQPVGGQVQAQAQRIILARGMSERQIGELTASLATADQRQWAVLRADATLAMKKAEGRQSSAERKDVNGEGWTAVEMGQRLQEAIKETASVATMPVTRPAQAAIHIAQQPATAPANGPVATGQAKEQTTLFDCLIVLQRNSDSAKSELVPSQPPPPAAAQPQAGQREDNSSTRPADAAK